MDLYVDTTIGQFTKIRTPRRRKNRVDDNVMVMVYCFICLRPQAEAPQKPSHAVNQPLAKIRPNENTMAH